MIQWLRLHILKRAGAGVPSCGQELGPCATIKDPASHTAIKDPVQVTHYYDIYEINVLFIY